MIANSISNRQLYTSLHPLFAKAFEFLANTDFNKLPLGKHTIDGDDLFVIYQEYDTKEVFDCKMESHKKYIDIQYMVEGDELMGVSILHSQVPSVPYDEEKDVAFYDFGYDSLLKIAQGHFAIFYPHDIHMPGIKSDKVSGIKKAVFKVRVPNG